MRKREEGEWREEGWKRDQIGRRRKENEGGMLRKGSKRKVEGGRREGGWREEGVRREGEGMK